MHYLGSFWPLWNRQIGAWLVVLVQTIMHQQQQAAWCWRVNHIYSWTCAAPWWLLLKPLHHTPITRSPQTINRCILKVNRERGEKLFHQHLKDQSCDRRLSQYVQHRATSSTEGEIRILVLKWGGNFPPTIHGQASEKVGRLGLDWGASKEASCGTVSQK